MGRESGLASTMRLSPWWTWSWRFISAAYDPPNESSIRLIVATYFQPKSAISRARKAAEMASEGNVRPKEGCRPGVENSVDEAA